MKKLLLSLILLVSTYIHGQCQNQSKALNLDYDWEPTKRTQFIPDSMLREDAVCIYNLIEIRNLRSNDVIRNRSIVVNKKRIKILTQKGLDQYSNFSMNYPSFGNLKHMDARTIKNDGSIVDFKASDLKIIYARQDKSIKRSIQLLSIPGVEIGDEIEFVYYVQSFGITEYKDVFLHEQIPVLTSVFRHVFDDGIFPDYKLYNGMPDPTINKQFNQSTYYWELKNLQGTNDNEYGIRHETLPFIRYSILIFNHHNSELIEFYRKANRSWKPMYDAYSYMTENEAFEKMYWGHSLEGLILKQNKKYPNQTIDQKIYFLNSILNDSLTITEYNDKSSARPAMFYLNNKKMDERTVYKFIDTYLKLNHIKYFIAFGRNRYEGNLDISFPTTKTITDIFYVIVNEKGELHYLYPPKVNKKFYVDELPTSISGSNAILIIDTGKFKTSEIAVSTMSIPYNDVNTNIWSKKTVVNINLNSTFQSNELKSQHTLMGDFSTDYRDSILNLNNERNAKQEFKNILDLNSNYKLDTFYTENLKKIFPYNYSFKYEGHIENMIQNLDSGYYSIRLNDLLHHYYLNTKEQKRTLDFYCPYAYSDISKIYLKFDKEIDVVNGEIFNSNKYQSDISNYEVHINKVDKNVLLIESKLTVSKIKATPSEYSELHQTNEAAKKAGQSRILIKTLN
jgi:Domain of Unknown Function with PDB structure (DUF3857)